jgi:outer membrane protein assembly factor BamA
MRTSLATILALLWFGAPPARAQPPAEGSPIVAVTVHGLRHIEEALVLRQMSSRVGTPFDRAVADYDVVRLDRLGVFSEIDITPVPVEGGVRLDVTVEETLRILPAISIAVSDSNGASAGPTVKLLSIRGAPHEMALTARFGGERLFQFTETSPLLVDERLWHTASLALRSQANKIDSFNERSLDLDARVGRRHSERWKTGAIFQVYSVQSDTAGITLSPDDSDVFTGAGAVTEYDSRNSWREASSGWWNSADATWRFGSGDYGTINLDVRRFQPVAPRQTVVATALATFRSGTSGEDVPTYLDYALGGANTVRGWDFNARRGKNQFIASLEYRYMVFPTRTIRVFGVNFYGGLALALFGDAGKAWGNPEHPDQDVIGGGGVGLRIYVPYVSLLRLDFSLGDGGFHRTLGINEKAVAQRNLIR